MCPHFVCVCFKSYPGDGKGQVEVLSSLQSEAPGGRAYESDAVVAAHGLLDGCYMCSVQMLLACDDTDSRKTHSR